MCLAFKTTCVDRGKPLREGAFSFTRTMLFPPLDKRNTRDKAKGLRITSERHIVGLGARYLSRINSGSGSEAIASLLDLGGGKGGVFSVVCLDLEVRYGG